MKCFISKIFELQGGNGRNNRIIVMSYLYDLLAEIESILQDKIQLCIFIKLKKNLIA